LIKIAIKHLKSNLTRVKGKPGNGGLYPHHILTGIEKYILSSFVFEKMQSENGARRNSKYRI
jgi:hypothetical protein